MTRLLAAALLFQPASLVLADEPAAPVPPTEAPGRMSVPEGFEVTLFAGEPDVVQPIAFTFDHRGRLWVVECLSYPKWSDDGTGNDRVSVFEDTDGDGRFDEKTVFLENGSNLSGIAVGYGGVWLCSLPNFLFVPDADGDDEPDGPPEVLLDGWSLDCKHNVFNGLTWGPDGWLYGCNGILATSMVGKPGTPEEDRTPMRCGVWRYHPTKHVFDVVARGFTNPWGLEFDDRGEIFVTNCVIKHLFHVVPGGHYERMYGEDLTENVYGLMPSCADYIHWGGGKWTTSRGGQGIHDAAGGGHAHVGCMIYRGDNWPVEYRGKLYTCNLHGRRVNVDSLHRFKSGYRSKREPDFLKANDPWFRGLELKYGPDGGVFMTDWSDTGECHDYDHCDRSNGRIHKITYGKTKPWKGDLAKLSLLELVRLFDHENEWFGRRAQLAFLERVRDDESEIAVEVAGAVEELVENGRTALARQRALTVVMQSGIGGVGALGYLGHERLEVRTFAQRLLVEEIVQGGKSAEGLARAAADEKDPFARLTFASLLQRLELDERKPIAMALLSRAEDADDPNIPLMIWYGIEPVVAEDPAWATKALRECKLPVVRGYIARRLASRTK